MKSPKRHVLLSLIFLLKCLSKSFFIRYLVCLDLNMFWMGNDLLVFHEAVINKVRQARHTPFRLLGNLMPKSRTSYVANLGRTLVEGMRSQLPPGWAPGCHSNRCEREWLFPYHWTLDWGHGLCQTIFIIAFMFGGEWSLSILCSSWNVCRVNLIM